VISLTGEVERKELIAQLRAEGVKHNPDDILRIARLPDGKIVFLERGNSNSGWQHIIEKRRTNFADRGILEDQIIDAIMVAVTKGEIVGIQGKSRSVYEVEFNDSLYYISIEVSTNGYIVGANPTPTKLIRRFSDDRE
jgi:hypothetical protein